MNILKNWIDSLDFATMAQNVLDKVAESPKLTVAASTFATTASVATAAQWINGVAAGAAVFAGLIATAALARVHWMNGNKAKMEAEEARLKVELLKVKLAELGIEDSEGANNG